MKKNKPTFAAESICVAGDFNTTYVELPQPMPCVVIFSHGANAEISGPVIGAKDNY